MSGGVLIAVITSMCVDNSNGMVVPPYQTTTSATPALQGFVVAPKFYKNREAAALHANTRVTHNTLHEASVVRKDVMSTRYRQQELHHFSRGDRVVRGGRNVLSGSSSEVRRKFADIDFTLCMGVADSGTEMGLDLASGLGARMGSFVDGKLCLEKGEIGREALPGTIVGPTWKIANLTRIFLTD